MADKGIERLAKKAKMLIRKLFSFSLPLKYAILAQNRKGIQ